MVSHSGKGNDNPSKTDRWREDGREGEGLDLSLWVTVSRVIVVVLVVVVVVAHGLSCPVGKVRP